MFLRLHELAGSIEGNKTPELQIGGRAFRDDDAKSRGRFQVRSKMPGLPAGRQAEGPGATFKPKALTGLIDVAEDEMFLRLQELAGSIDGNKNGPVAEVRLSFCSHYHLRTGNMNHDGGNCSGFSVFPSNSRIYLDMYQRWLCRGPGGRGVDFSIFVENGLSKKVAPLRSEGTRLNSSHERRSRMPSSA